MSYIMYSVLAQLNKLELSLRFSIIIIIIFSLQFSFLLNLTSRDVKREKIPRIVHKYTHKTDKELADDQNSSYGVET